jgi:hypothetical protein
LARQVAQVISATGAGTPIGLDWMQSPFNVSIQVVVLAGTTANFGVQYTMDDPNGGGTVTWTYDANIVSGTTTTAVGNYNFPVQAVRINVASISGGNIIFNVLQGMGAV